MSTPQVWDSVLAHETVDLASLESLWQVGGLATEVAVNAAVLRQNFFSKTIQFLLIGFPAN